ncbi:MAG TPA: TIGR04255 family protein [Bacteroidales bacterium]|nr:TIGR04255 family protein [Bacteroidales bacterium]
MKLPKSIEPCPIIESIIELRFLTNEPDDAIFGLFHREIRDQFNEVNKLPILDLPEKVRKAESNLKFKPYYKFSNTEFDINLGPRVISIIKKEPYSGWKKFSNTATNMVKVLKELDIVTSLERLGLRYINFFDYDVYEKVDVKLTLGGENFIKNDTLIKNTYKMSGYDVTLQLSNSSTLKNDDKIRNGSVLDIDVSLKSLRVSFLTEPQNELNDIHTTEKEIFFNLLKEEFVINNLNPKY